MLNVIEIYKLHIFLYNPPILKKNIFCAILCIYKYNNSRFYVEYVDQLSFYMIEIEIINYSLTKFFII